MIATLTNSSSTSPGGAITLNVQKKYNGAVGGTVQNALPYPMNADAASAVPVIPSIFSNIAPSATLVLGFHEDDFHFKRVPSETFFPRTEWNTLINAGIVSLAFTSENNAGTDFTSLGTIGDVEDDAIGLIATM